MKYDDLLDCQMFPNKLSQKWSVIYKTYLKYDTYTLFVRNWIVLTWGQILRRSPKSEGVFFVSYTKMQKIAI